MVHTGSTHVSPAHHDDASTRPREMTIDSVSDHPSREGSWYVPLISALVVILLALMASPLFPGSAGRILVPGVFHAGEVEAEPGSTWLAVVPQLNHGYVVEEAVIELRAVNDPIVDGEGETTGVEITAPSCFRPPLFLVQGIDAIQTGFFDTTISDPELLQIDRAIPITLVSRRHYALMIDCSIGSWISQDGVMECPLVLAHELNRQALGTFAVEAPPDSDWFFADGAAPEVLWAGDIDRDRKLDLLLEMSSHGNVSAPTLFLSSFAGEGEVVGEVASLWLTGC